MIIGTVSPPNAHLGLYSRSAIRRLVNEDKTSNDCDIEMRRYFVQNSDQLDRFPIYMNWWSHYLAIQFSVIREDCRYIAATTLYRVLNFYRAMHFSAKRGIAIACRLSVCLSVCNVGEL